MSSIIDSAADIRIYNYKTGTVHTEKGVVIYDTATNTFKCFGNECAEVFDKLQDVETGLYRESSAYIYDLYKDELNFGHIVQAEI